MNESPEKNSGKAGKRYQCLCCGYWTLESRGEYDICPVCFWEDDAYLYIEEGIMKAPDRKEHTSDHDPDEALLDMVSSANHGLTLRMGRENYKRLGACTEKMLPYVREPYGEEMP